MSGRTVLWATCAQVPDGDADDHLALPAVAAEGLTVRYQVWDDPTADWSRPTVVRSTWDYTTRREEFLAWAARVPTLLNPAEVLAWNTDKAYLAELAAAGLAVVPSTVLRPGDDAREAVRAAQGAASEVVVKPTVSAGSRDTRRHRAADAAVAHADELLGAGRPVLLQPYLDGVDTAGETGMVVVDGVVSHAFCKGQLLYADAPATDDLYAEEDITATTASAAQLELAHQVTAWLARRFPAHAPLLYARVDTVPGPDGHPLLLELELTEPSLWLIADPEAGRAFAAALRRRVDLVP